MMSSMAPMMSSVAPTDPHAVHETSAVRSAYPSNTSGYPVMTQANPSGYPMMTQARMPTGIYQPNGTLYVGSAQPLKGGMTPVYERHIVPTFEAPLEWRVGAEHIDSFVDTTIRPPVSVVERGASSSSSSSDRHERTKKQRTCCKSHAASANSHPTKRQSGCCKSHNSPSKTRRHKSSHAKSKRSKCC